jgi:hypothetical protein
MTVLTRCDDVTEQRDLERRALRAWVRLKSSAEMLSSKM